MIFYDSILQFNGNFWEPLDISEVDVEEPDEKITAFAKVIIPPDSSTSYNQDTIHTISNWTQTINQNVNVNLSGSYTFQIIHPGVYKIESNLNFKFQSADNDLRSTSSSIIKIDDTLTPENIILHDRSLSEAGGIYRNFSSAVTRTFLKDEKIALSVKSEIQYTYVLDYSSFSITKID